MRSTRSRSLMAPAILLLAGTTLFGCQDNGLISGPLDTPISQVVASPEAIVLDGVGSSVQLSATAYDAAGSPIEALKTWKSLNTEAADVDRNGRVITRAAGVALIVVAAGGHADTTQVTVRSTPAPPVASAGEFVAYPNQEVAFILGPQLKSGSSANPWPWFDENAITTGLRHGAAYSNTNDLNYYDQIRVQYLNYYRTGDERFLQYARAIADLWYDGNVKNLGTGVAPRNVSLSGLMLRALDGRPEMWDWILAWTNQHLHDWLELRIDKEKLHYGVRDGGYALYYGALIAATHPDPAVRAEYKTRVLTVARDYYARLQYSNGGWYWNDSAAGIQIAKEDGTYWRHSQPFMVGLLLEALVATHQLTGDPVVEAAIVRGTEWLYTYGYRHTMPSPQEGVDWRGGWYFVFEPGTPLPDPAGYTEGNAPQYGTDGITVVQGGTTLRGGWDTNSIREKRQALPLQIHAFGYAYAITGDTRFREWGDEYFSAAFGKGQGPGADPYYCLADYIAKDYNQAYRSSGTYLARRLGAVNATVR